MKYRVTLAVAWRLLILESFVLILLIVGVIFVGHKLYAKVSAAEVAQKELIRLQEEARVKQSEEAQKLLSTQQEELLAAKTELEKTKTESAKTSAQIRTLTQTLDQAKAEKEIVISSADLSPYVTGIVQVICVTGKNVTSGSGSLFTFKDVKHAVLTNLHVVQDADRCVIVITSTANTITGVFSLLPAVYTYNKNTDEAILEIGKPLSSNSVPVENYNYSLATLKRCTSLVPIGTPVVIVGYPAYAKRDSTITIETLGTIQSVYRTATNGIVSGYDTSASGDANYFVSAKIDNGNSGGIALAKDTHGICTLGLPTWLTVGNYETQGLVQNITNILPTKE